MKHTQVGVCAVLAGTAAGIVIAQAGEYDSGWYNRNRQVTTALTGTSVLSIAWASTRDVGTHLYRDRAGIRPGSESYKKAVPSGVTDAKGGMKMADVVISKPNRWEIFGSLFYYNEDLDGSAYKKSRCGSKKITSSDTSLEVYGGTVGVEYRFESDWSAGLAVSGSRADLEVGTIGTSDVDSFAVTPYVSYYRADALGSADLWGSLMYSYGMHSYDTRRYTWGGIASGSPDADTNTVELTVGLNFGEDEFVHGPYAGARYITGSIDAYRESGRFARYVPGQDVESLVSILGYQASWRIPGGSGTWVPHIRAAWEHEFEDGSSTSFGIPLETLAEDIAVAGAGIGYYWDNGWFVVLEYEGRFASGIQGHYGGLSAGKEF